MRYVLLFRGKGPAPAEDLNRIAKVEGLTVIHARASILLVEFNGTETDLSAAFDEAGTWIVSEQRTYYLS
jgi:hypothetical protein